MSKPLNINLGSQREIQREGTRKNVTTSTTSILPVGRIQTNFYLPELKIDSTEDSLQKSSPPVQKVVSRINKFIENIADDYFLPGLSGSFILLILGKYAFITAALRNPFNLDNLEIILVFVAGCLVGVLGFSRILRYALERWHDYTLAVLTGIMLGSMRKVWPWKITLESQIIRGNEHTLREENVWPLLDFELGIALLLMGTGFLMVMLLDKVPKQQN